MKIDLDFFNVWGGIAGVQQTLGLLLNVQPPLPLPRIADLTACVVASRYRIPHKGHISAGGYDADHSLVDLKAAEVLNREHLFQRHKISPYLGMKIHGMIQRTILRGRTIFLDGRIVGEPSGQFVRPVRG